MPKNRQPTNSTLPEGLDQPRPGKKMRLQNPPDKSFETEETEHNSTSGPCHLSRMPFEIIADILQSTSSPKDVLAFARCCKFFCKTLVQPSADYIWRNVRKHCKPAPIPDPTPNFTEASFAAFMFDHGLCQVCQTAVKKPYMSFSMRIRICGSLDCRKTLRTEFVIGRDFGTMLWIPTFESSACLFPEHSETQWPNLVLRYFPREEYEKISQEFRAVPYMERDVWLREKAPEMTKTRKWMNTCHAVYTWYKGYRAKHTVIKAQNEVCVERMATAEGWNKNDLLLASSFAKIFHRRNKLLENVTQSDFDSVRPGLDDEIIQICERQKRRTEEKIVAQRRAEVAHHLHRLRSDGKSEPLPNLATFRQFPVIKLVQNHTSAKKASVELRSTLIAEILRDEMGRWRDSAKASLAAMLGHPNWKCSSSKKLNPAERVTARFKCKRCSTVERKYSQDECLDFAGVCAHECMKSIGKRKAKASWQADQFVPDNKAISVVTQVLKLCNIDPSARDSLEAVKNIGTRIMCLSCDSVIVMNFQNLFGHCQRHDDMQVSLLPESETSILAHPFSPGLSSKLLSRSYEAKRLRSLREYGCRHCFQKKPSSDTMDDGDGQPDTKTPPKPTPPEPDLFTFDGLRSHCKQKHRIKLPRDEDFFRVVGKENKKEKENDIAAFL